MAALLLLVLGLSSAAGYQIVRRRATPSQTFKGPSPLLLFGLQLALVNIASLVLVVIDVPVSQTGVGFLVSASVLAAGYLVVVWLFGFRSGALDAPAIGLPSRPAVRQMLADLATGASTMLVVAVLASLWGALWALLLGTQAPEVLPPPATGFDALLLVIGACLLVPLGEEVFFRGYSLSAWWRDLGERSALLRATAFFAFVHVININSATFLDGAKQALLVVLVIAPVGFALGTLFIRRGLLAAIAGHAAYNLLGVLVLIAAQSQS